MRRAKVMCRGNQELGPDLRSELLARRYLYKDADGRVTETPDGMFRRVANAVAAQEDETNPAEQAALAQRLFEVMRKGLFLPNSPALMNAGRPRGLLGACFVLPVPDSIDGIFESIRQTAMVQKAGGGTGFSFDSLRPTGDLVSSSGGATSGPLSFMKVYSEATNAIQQGAFRRGANMAMMSVRHPDILKFITAKGTPGAFANFNFSVKIPDEFMRRLADHPGRLHEVVNPRNGERYVIPKSVALATYAIQDLLPASRPRRPCYSVADVWNLVVRSAHASGEPGVCFIDRINADNPTPQLGRIEATNPCGEQALLPYESCILGSVDISKFVADAGHDLDWKRLEQTIHMAIRCLDNMVSISTPDLPAIESARLRTRKIGLGIMGFADALVLLGVRYDSEDALGWAGRIGSFLTDTAHKASEKLAGTKGSFPAWAGSVWDTRHHRPMRNAACTTIAPTGSISIIAGCSSGIEPIFALASRRKALDGREFVALHPLIERLGAQGDWLTNRVRRGLLLGKPPRDISGFPQDLASLVVTAHEVPPDQHVRVQAAFQQHIDNSISKTVNLPATATVADVDHIYRRLHALGCNGGTVYRDGSRAGQALTSAAAVRSGSRPDEGLQPRPRVTSGRTLKYRMGCGTLFVTVNRDEKGLCEVFANLGKAGGCPAQSEATCRAISASLRSGVKPEILIEQLKGIRCQATSVARKGNSEIDVLSCPDAIARALEESCRRRTPRTAQASPPCGRSCPACGEKMRRESGCFVCDACKYNSCG